MIVEEEYPPPSPPPEQAVHPEPAAAEPEDTHDAPPAEAEPEYPYEAQPAEPDFEYSYETPPTDACEYEVRIEPCCCPQEAARPAEQDGAKDERAHKVAADTNAPRKNANVAEGEMGGFGFTWCFRCLRVDVILYGSKTLPTEMRGADCQLDDGIATIMCGHCKSKGAGNPQGRYNGGLLGQSGVADFRSSFEKLKLSPVIFGGSEVAQAARVILSFEVPFITANDGVAFKDIDEIVRRLTVEDRVMSVDMKGFREGKRENLLLPYLAGGLTM